MAKTTLTYLLLFTGGTRYQRIKACDCVIGAAGEARFFVERNGAVSVSIIIAPGQWRYIDIVYPEDRRAELFKSDELAAPSGQTESAAVE